MATVLGETIALPVALPLASVAISALPRYVWPSPLPLAEQVGDEKNSRLKIVLAVLFRLQATRVCVALALAAALTTG